MAETIKNLNKIINYDAKSDVFYVGVKGGGEEEFREIAPGINIELDKKGEVIGIEILNASKIFKSAILSAKSKAAQKAFQKEAILTQ